MKDGRHPTNEEEMWDLGTEKQSECFKFLECFIAYLAVTWCIIHYQFNLTIWLKGFGLFLDPKNRSLIAVEIMWTGRLSVPLSRRFFCGTASTKSAVSCNYRCCLDGRNTSARSKFQSTSTLLPPCQQNQKFLYVCGAKA